MKRREPDSPGEDFGAASVGAPPAKRFKSKEAELDPGFVPLLAPNRGLDERICRLESNLAHLQQVCSLQARTITTLRVQNQQYASQLKTLRRIVTKQMKNGEPREIDGSPLCTECGSFLLSLPAEVTAHIVGFCDFQDKLSLRTVSTDLHWIVSTTVTEFPYSLKTNLMMKGARSFPNLTRLFVTGDINSLGFKYVTSLGKLRSLVVSNVKNFSDDCFSLLTACTNLRSLAVRTVYHFSDRGMEYIYQLTRLKNLELRDLLNVSFPSSPALAESLETLTVRDCLNFRANFPLLGEYTSLRHLYIDSAPCEQLYCLKFTTSLVNLESLVLTPWVSKSEQPQLRMCYLTNLTNLTRLDLQCNAVVDWESLASMTTLQSLAVSSNFVEDELDHLLSLPRLKSLSICYNDNIDDGLFDRLAPLSDQLVDLDLQGCPMITKAATNMMEVFTQLTRLNLKETAVSKMDFQEGEPVPAGVILSEAPEELLQE